MYTYEYSVEQTFANNSLFLCAAFKQGKVDVTLKVQSSNEYFCFLRKSKKIFHILLGCENVKDYWRSRWKISIINIKLLVIIFQRIKYSSIEIQI